LPAWDEGTTDYRSFVTFRDEIPAYSSCDGTVASVPVLNSFRHPLLDLGVVIADQYTYAHRGQDIIMHYHCSSAYRSCNIKRPGTFAAAELNPK
jgi:hypothetical protein